MAARARPADDPCADEVVARLLVLGRKLATAESFTGGRLAAAITAVPGASAVFPVGWVTYASEQKSACLGVPAALIESAGVVSEQVAAAMAEGALLRAAADLALASTGCAGPEVLVQAGRPDVPVGRCYLALARVGYPTQVRGFDFAPPRENIQRLGVEAALALVLEALA